jgi:catechol 2,3-dioxygenase-like lactoylglutathione lyase family enzyme
LNRQRAAAHVQHQAHFSSDNEKVTSMKWEPARLITVGVYVLHCGAAAGQSPEPAHINPMQLRPDHLTASVANLDKEVAWYERVFGMSATVSHNRGPDFKVVHLSLGAVYHIDLAWQRGSVRQKEANYFRQGWEHVVFTTPAIEAAYKRLIELGTDARPDRNAQGLIWRIFVHDPEGNEIEMVANDGEARTGVSLVPSDTSVPPPAIPETVLPAGENRVLVIRTCTACHSAQYIVAGRHTAAEWAGTMAAMVARGAVVTDDEKIRILEYLDHNFGR